MSIIQIFWQCAYHNMNLLLSVFVEYHIIWKYIESVWQNTRYFNFLTLWAACDYKILVTFIKWRTAFCNNQAAFKSRAIRCDSQHCITVTAQGRIQKAPAQCDDLLWIISYYYISFVYLPLRCCHCSDVSAQSAKLDKMLELKAFSIEIISFFKDSIKHL